MSDLSAAATDEAAHEKDFVIIVNGERKTVEARKVSFEEVVTIAYPTPPDPNTTFIVTYRKAREPKHEGILVEGESVEVKNEGTIINVSPTGKS